MTMGVSWKVLARGLTIRSKGRTVVCSVWTEFSKILGNIAMKVWNRRNGGRPVWIPH